MSISTSLSSKPFPSSRTIGCPGRLIINSDYSPRQEWFQTLLSNNSTLITSLICSLLFRLSSMHLSPLTNKLPPLSTISRTLMFLLMVIVCLGKNRGGISLFRTIIIIYISKTIRRILSRRRKSNLWSRISILILISWLFRMCLVKSYLWTNLIFWMQIFSTLISTIK